MNDTTELNNVEVMKDGSVVLVRTVFLVLFLLMSLLGNSAGLFTLVLAKQQTSNPFNAYLLSMCAYGLLECTLNISLATGFSLESAWVFDNFWQGFNACFIQLQCIGTLLTITVMSIDRFIAVIKWNGYLTESACHKANYIVLYTWFHAFVFSLPLIFQNESLGLTVRSFVERNTCGLTEYTSTIYSVSVLVICYAIPGLLSILFLVIVFLKSSKQNRQVNRSNTPYYIDYFMQESHMLNHAQTTRFIVLLFVLYLLLKGPYVAIDFLTQFHLPMAYIPVNVSISNSSHSEVESPDGSKFYFQTVIAWLSFCFSPIYPIIMFAWFNEHKKRLQENCCCVKMKKRKSVDVNDQLPRITTHLGGRTTRIHINNNNNNKRKTNFLLRFKQKFKVTSQHDKNSVIDEKHLPAHGGFRVPVLYAAADGLHLVASHSVMSQNTGRLSAHTQTHFPHRNGSSGYAGSESEQGPSVKSAYNIQVDHESVKAKTTPSNLFKRLYSGATVNAENQTVGNFVIESQDSRPSSVVDKRLDVNGSVKCVQSDEESYFNSLDFDDDYGNESDLNQSANSRTLILPNTQKDCKVISNSNADWPSLPHTPSPKLEKSHASLSELNVEKHNWKRKPDDRNHVSVVIEKNADVIDTELQYFKSLNDKTKELERSSSALNFSSVPGEVVKYYCEQHNTKDKNSSDFTHAQSYPKLSELNH